MEEVIGKAKGGKARAEALSPEQRREIAKKASKARWQPGDPNLPKATHPGELKIGSITLPCSVLENGTRVLSARGIDAAFTGKGGGQRSQVIGAHKIPRFLASKDISPFISQDLMVHISKPISYQPFHGGKNALGYEATLLPEICEVILDANKANPLKDQAVAGAAEMLIRGFARVGIIALVDEATGYQADREKDALTKLLEKFLVEERLKWAKTFPIEFYKEIYRLNKWAWPPQQKARYTPLVGKYTNEVVYDRLPPGVLIKLREKNPTNPSTKRRRWKHTQFLTPDFGHPALRALLIETMALMRGARSWPEFLRILNRSLPKGGSYQLEFEDANE